MEKKGIIVTVAVVSALLASSVTAIAATYAGQESPDQKAIKSVVSEAVDSFYKLPVVSDTQYSSLSSSIATTSAATVDSLMNSKSSSQTAFFTGDALSNKKGQIKIMLSKLKTGNFKGEDGGASNFTYNLLSINENTAQVIVVADVWSKYKTKSSTGQWTEYTPHNKVIFNDALSKDQSGQWKITSEQMDFVPGYQP